MKLDKLYLQIAAFAAMLVLSQLALAQAAARISHRNIQFSNLTTEHGLSSEFVQDIAQDGPGYIWFATQSGLNRYNGHEVKFYENVANDPTSLSSSFIWSLHVDKRGDLWIGTERGLNRYDRETDTFVRKPWENLSLSNLRVRRILEDRLGFIWLGTIGEGLLRIDPISGETAQFTFDANRNDSLPNDQVVALIEDSRGQVWVGTDGGGLARFERASESFIRYPHNPDNPLSLPSDRIRSIYEDADHRLWVGTAPGGLSVMDTATGRVTRFEANSDSGLPAGQVTTIFEDGRDILWIGTESGLAEWRPESGRFLTYGNRAGDTSSLVNDRISAIIQDKSGVLWLATYGGVSSWNYFSDTFRYYRALDDYVQSDLVSSIDETSDGTLWIGTYGGGLSRVNPQSDVVTHFRHDDNVPGSLSDDRVMTLHVDDNDNVWVGTRDGGLDYLPKGADRFTHYVNNPDNNGSISGNAITRIKTTSDGNLWVGVFDGGLNLLPAGKRGRNDFIRFSHDPDDASSLPGNRVLAIHEDSDGSVWIGAEDAGLSRLVSIDEGFESFSLEHALTGNGDSRPSGTPWEIHESRDGTLWLGTLGQGLFRWDKSDRDRGIDNFQQFSSGQGFASDIYGILEGNSGELWLSSNRGLIRFEPEQRRVRRFDRNNGLRTNEFNQGARLKSRSGQLFYGSTSGLVGFFPGELPTNQRPPDIAMTASSRSEVIGRTYSGAPKPQFEVQYFNAFVSFEFDALDFTSPDKNRYRYRMIGLDSNWTEVEQFRRAIYTGLSPGSYTFEVQATNNDGVWNLGGAAMDIYVIPPPWSTWWAYVIYVLIGLGAAAWYVLRQQALRLAEVRDRERLELLVSERTHELAARNEELTLLNDRLEQASVTDALTGLRNRRFVDQHIESELSMLRRLIHGEDPEHENPDSPRFLFMMMIDLDGFKAINDSYGHHAGDRALLEVKERLLTCCRKSDAVVRWWGDEFLIIGHARAMEGAEIFAEKIRQSIGGTPYDLGEGNYGKLSGSIGLCALPVAPGKLDFATWEQACNIADTASYIVKRSTKDSWVSILGTDTLEKGDVPLIRNNLAELISTGKVRVVSASLTDESLSELLAAGVTTEAR